MIFVVNSAYDDADISAGDGVCFDGFFLDVGNTLPECSLRAAIEEANATAGTDSVIIRIDIRSIARAASATGDFGYNAVLDLWRIEPNVTESLSLGPLPAIARDNVHIDGTWQLDGSGVGTFPDAYCGEQFTGGPTDSSIVKVMIDGLSLHPDSTHNLLEIAASDVSIRGVAVSNATSNGIVATGVNRLNFDCLHVGTDHLGKAAEPNVDHGILVQGGYNHSLSRSLLSGNGMSGMTATGDTTYVSRSFFGTDREGGYAIANGGSGLHLGGYLGFVDLTLASGNALGIAVSGSEYHIESSGVGLDRMASTAIPNGMDGIYVGGGSNEIGGPEVNMRSYVGGNLNSGIHLADTSTFNEVKNVWVGLNLAGTSAIPNGAAGVTDSSSTNKIGEVPPPQPPVDPTGSRYFAPGGSAIAKTNAPLQAGTVVSGNAANGILASDRTTIVNTFVGVDPTGAFAIPNTGCGVRFDTGASHTVGGTAPGEGNLISGNTDAGICAFSTGGFIYGNYVGTNWSGSSAIPNGSSGIKLLNSYSVGSEEGGKNVISGNTGSGIRVTGSENAIEANFIGTNAAGTAALPNTGPGIELTSTSFGNSIGGSDTGEGNLISGNSAHGIQSEDDIPFIVGNYIGTDVTGTSAIPNAFSGILGLGTGGTIGSGVAGGRNLISGNGGNGILLADPGSQPGRAESASKSAGFDYNINGNIIGADAGGVNPLPNQDHGILNDAPFFAVVGNGSSASSENIIAFNGRAGIRATGSGTTYINRNRIFANGELGIDLGGPGVTPNDTGPPHDTDTGPNSLQNFPEILSAQTVNVDSTLLSFEFRSLPSTPFQFHLFVNDSPDPSLHGEGQTWAASFSGNTDGTGFYGFNDYLAGTGFPAGSWVTMLATNNNTIESSEFSGAVQVMGPGIVLDSAMVFLEGPYAAGSMATNLLAGGDIPLSQPYSDPAFNGALSEFDESVVASSIPAGTVDWVSLILRLGIDPIDEVARRVAFVQEDGFLTDLDGSLFVNFPKVSNGNYHLVVCHRNHLCAMSASLIDFTSGEGTWDFTTALSQAYSGGGSAMKALGDGNFGLFAGDNNADGIVTAPDFNTWNAETTSGTTGYAAGDHNLDALVTAPDFNQWNANTTAGAASQVPW